MIKESPSPRSQVLKTFSKLFGDDLEIVVSGRRSPGRRGSYVTEASVDGHVVARASHSDWRKSYKMLRIEVENAYYNGLSLV
jgi:hypothetical protein